MEIVAMPPDARAYVLETWRRSIPRRKRQRSHGEANRLRERLVDGERVAVAMEGGAVVGWACYTPLPSAPVVHYVYVRASHRGRRIPAAILDHAGAVPGRAVPVTMTTPRAASIASRAGARLRLVDVAEVLA